MGNEILDSNSNLNSTPSANRLHISFFGRRNAGKSSVVNAVTGQELSIVSKIKGTTTDPVIKAMELLPIGPVLIIDTPGIDDIGEIGKKRIEKTNKILVRTDVAVLIVDHFVGITDKDLELIKMFKDRNIPFIVAFNKVDLSMESLINSPDPVYDFPNIKVSALTGQGIKELKELIGKIGSPIENSRKILGDLINPGETLIFVTPIDASAPKGRMILPQVQALRDALDCGGCPLFTQVPQLAQCLQALREKPSLVVTDSQAFEQVRKIVPDDIYLTSFSILFARYKGILETAVNGALYLDELRDGDTVLISEGCTHHRQCEDIGTVKLPKWIEKYCGKTLNFKFTSGGEFPLDLSPYALIVHCGGCMLNEREMLNRMSTSSAAKVPFTNYGTLIAHINGILKRSIEIFEGKNE